MPVRTTIVLDEELMDKLRLIAASHGTGLSRAISDLIRAGMKLTDDRSGPGYEFTWKTFRGRVMPGADIDDRDRLYDIMEGRS